MEIGSWRRQSAVYTATWSQSLRSICHRPGQEQPYYHNECGTRLSRGERCEKLNNQYEMRERSEDSAHFSSGRGYDERSTRDMLHTEG
jgi:hypothetical protein